MEYKNKTYEVNTEPFFGGGLYTTIAYATGNPEDILKFYDEKKHYTIWLKELKVDKIKPESLEEKNQLLKEKENLEAKLKAIVK